MDLITHPISKPNWIEHLPQPHRTPLIKPEKTPKFPRTRGSSRRTGVQHAGVGMVSAGSEPWELGRQWSPEEKTLVRMQSPLKLTTFLISMGNFEQIRDILLLRRGKIMTL